MSASDKKKMRKEQKASTMTEKQQAASKEAKKLHIMTISFVVIIALFIGMFGYITVDKILIKTAFYEKNTIIANVDNQDLNQIDFTFYYVDAIQAFYNNVYNTYTDSTALYLSTINLDLNKPLDEQTNASYDDTWFAYFAEQALTNAKSDYALSKLAASENFDASKAIESKLATAKSNLAFYASYYGSLDNYLSSKYCNGANEASYTEYLTRSIIASEYYNAHLDTLSYTDSDYRTYEADKYNNFSSFDFASYTVNYESFLKDGQTSEDGKTTTYTDEQRDAARVEAKIAAEKLVNCTTIEEFNAAIAALSYNEGKTVTSNTNEKIHYSAIKTVYGDWLGDAERKTGDMKAFPVESTTTDANGNERTVINSYTVLMYLDTDKNQAPLSNVRQLLVSFKNGTTDANGNTTYTDEQKAEAKAKADDLYAEWQEKGGDKETFIEMIATNSDDGSASTGGLYEHIHRDCNYVPEFLNWSIDASRKEGDSGIVATQYGYHIMYFDGYDELSYRDLVIDDALKSEAMESWYNNAVDTVEASVVSYDKLDKIASNHLI